MYGAIIGDLAGSVYEYDEFNNSEKGIIDLQRRLEILHKKDLIDKESFYSDDTILIIAILDCILNNVPYEVKLKEYGLKYGTERLNKPNQTILNICFQAILQSGAKENKKAIV